MAIRFRSTFLWILFVGIGLTAGIAVTLAARSLPGLRHLLADEHGEAGGADGHDDGAAAGAGSVEAGSLELSDQARKNIGLTLVAVELRDFQRTVTIPAVLADRPGRSQITVSAPMTGIVTRVYPIRGEAVAPGDPLFQLRLTHEDLVEKQSAVLQAMEKLDVIEQEVARLEQVTASGAIAGKRLLETRYEQRKTEAAIRAGREALLLHGLTEAQVEDIAARRRLVSNVQVDTPAPDEAHGAAAHEAAGHADLFQVAQLSVKRGDHVVTGSPLAVLTDHCELYIEGKAFEHDAEVLNRAANEAAEVSALVEGNGSGKREVTGLRILYVENRVERDSRALRFYVTLPNELVRNDKTEHDHRFVAWRYRPGQRVELLVPVESWKSCIVLPVEAVVQEGAEWFVYRQVGSRFDRRPVHVEYRDQRSAVLENDGTLFPGDVLAAKGAYQIHLDLKNKAGGGVDPHAGHHH